MCLWNCFGILAVVIALLVIFSAMQDIKDDY